MRKGSNGDTTAEISETGPLITSLQGDSRAFAEWADEWMSIARYEGRHVPDVDTRIQTLLELWRRPIPGNWKRGIDQQLLGPRYRRRDIDNPHAGEHAIEYAILVKDFDRVTCNGMQLLDGINALPLARDCSGGRAGNVESDLFLLCDSAGEKRIFLCEVKSASDTSWYAAVENLRQLRLLQGNEVTIRVFHCRRPELGLPAQIPITGVVLAPSTFYVANGRKQNAVDPTIRLLKTLRDLEGVNVQLAVWDETRTCINVNESPNK